jgi:hypothetical protein
MPELRKILTLTGNNDSLKTFLAANSVGITGLSMNLTYLHWRVKSGGPVAKGDSTMASLADGDSYDLDEGDTEAAYGTDRIDATKIYFRGTSAGDKVYIEARSA